MEECGEENTIAQIPTSDERRNMSYCQDGGSILELTSSLTEVPPRLTTLLK
jgi:hypothetical protein